MSTFIYFTKDFFQINTRFTDLPQQLTEDCGGEMGILPTTEL